MYANQLGNKYNPAQEAVDIHDKRITDLTNSDIGKTLVVTDELNLVPQELDLSNYMVKGVDYVTAGRKSGTTAGTKSTAEGNSTTSSGQYSHSEGDNTYALDYSSHAEGGSTISRGESSHAEGDYTTAYGEYSHAEGYGNYSEVFQLTSEDDRYLVLELPYTTELEVGDVIRLLDDPSKVDKITSVNGDYITVNNPYRFGTDLEETSVCLLTGVSTGNSSHSEGEETIAKGSGSHSEGFRTVSVGDYSHSEGQHSKSIGAASHAEGDSTAIGNDSHSEGDNTQAYSDSSHAEGYGTMAGGYYSHAEGESTRTSGQGSHSEGYSTNANGNYSHTEGKGTIADRQSQHVFGEYNVRDSGTGTTKGTYIEIVGNGTLDNNRSNARTLDWNGNETLSGKLTVGAAPSNNMDVATKQYVDTAIQTALQAIPDVSVEGM